MSWELVNWVLKIYKKEAIFRILDVLAIKIINGLPRLRLLPIIIKLMLSTLLVAYKDKL
jgi:hypothetical protein